MKRHYWNAGHNPWPLWFMKRVSDMSERNCIFDDVDVRCVNTFQPPARLGHEAFVDNCDRTVPVLLNTSAVAEGEELVVYWPPRQVSTAGRPSSQITWASQARAKLDNQQKYRQK